MRFNDAAAQDLETNYKSARLRVGVLAEDSSTGEKAHAVKFFRFTRPQ